MHEFIFFVARYLVSPLIVIVVLMSMCAYAVLAERKISSWIQNRVGPNRTQLPILAYVPVAGRWLQRIGFSQPMADGLKFLFKEDVLPGHVKKFYYVLAPCLSLMTALLTCTVVPFGLWWDAEGLQHPLVLADVDIGLLFILAVSSLGVYGLVLAGWASNSKYPFMGGIRASAQLISYELAMGMALLPVFLWSSKPGVTSPLNLYSIVEAQNHLWLVFWQPVSALIFLVSLFAETNRLPFDMAESETDLVGGFHTEYGSFKFGFFFIAEYAHMIVGSAVFVLLFCGGWNFLPGLPTPWPHNLAGSAASIVWFLLKVVFFVFFFIWIRWTLPRFRYDQVMKLGWNMLLPLAVANFCAYLVFFALFPNA
ncbi:MAG TPA: complex I subunit 1 family protein [Opitutales bacterium]|nr:complex I subunit 1 family protein [Opitutales bacterium]